jgi:hypothetical protein
MEWSIENYQTKGLPRPHIVADESLRYQDGKFYLHPRTPIPWQSQPMFKYGGKLQLIQEHEKHIYDNNLCPFCGITFKEAEDAIRWVTNKSIPTENGPSVLSDFYPFHLECMKQGRIFCPYMRNLQDKDFEIGIIDKLRQDAVEQIESLVLKNDKDF